MPRSLDHRRRETELRRELAQLRKVAKKPPLHAPTKPDRGRERDNAHLAFIRRLPCVATYIETGQLVYGCQAAHLRLTDASRGKPHPGKGVKPDDRWTTPLTAEQHRIQGDVKGERRFWSDLGIDPIDLCNRLFAVSGDLEAGVAAIMEHIREKAA